MWWGVWRPMRPISSWSASEHAKQAAMWALQYTPKVVLSANDALFAEVSSCLRLWGGFRKLSKRLDDEACTFELTQASWGPNPFAGLCLSHADVRGARTATLASVLDGLPVECLVDTSAVLPTLHQLGCYTLGHLRALPRAGLSRRFGRTILDALDRAYGTLKAAHTWVLPPDSFTTSLELPQRVDNAGALLFAAKRLVLALCGWLAARQAGVTAITFGWLYDTMRARDVEAEGELVVRTATATRDPAYLMRLLGEHLDRTVLKGPVNTVKLGAAQLDAIPHPDGVLFPDKVKEGEAFERSIEVIRARLGASSVLVSAFQDDARVGHLQRWDEDSGMTRMALDIPPRWPQPTWIFREPLRLLVRGNRPLYQGPLELLAGPHRVNNGWWDCHQQGGDGWQRRDYWLARSPSAGNLWIYRELRSPAEGDWFLHGVFS